MGEHLAVNLGERSPAGDGFGSIASRAESVIETFGRQSVRKTACVTNQNDMVVKGVVATAGNEGSLGFQVGTTHVVEHLAEPLGRSIPVTKALHVTGFVWEDVVIPQFVSLRDVDDDGISVLGESTKHSVFQITLGYKFSL